MYNTTIYSTFAIPWGVAYASGIAGNILALVLLIMSRKQHKWIPFYRLYTGLFITDLVFWTSVNSQVIIIYASNFNDKFTFSQESDSCRYNSFMLLFANLSSAFILCALSVDRLKAMCSKDDKHHGNLYVGVLIWIWVIVGLYSSIHLLTHKTQTYYPGTWCYIDFLNTTNDTVGKINAYSYVAIVITVIFSIAMLNFLMLFLACCNLELRARLVDRQRIPGGYDYHSYFFLATVAIVTTELWTPHIVR